MVYVDREARLSYAGVEQAKPYHDALQGTALSLSQRSQSSCVDCMSSGDLLPEQAAKGWISAIQADQNYGVISCRIWGAGQRQFSISCRAEELSRQSGPHSSVRRGPGSSAAVSRAPPGSGNCWDTWQHALDSVAAASAAATPSGGSNAQQKPPQAYGTQILRLLIQERMCRPSFAAMHWPAVGL